MPQATVLNRAPVACADVKSERGNPHCTALAAPCLRATQKAST